MLVRTRLQQWDVQFPPNVPAVGVCGLCEATEPDRKKSRDHQQHKDSRTGPERQRNMSNGGDQALRSKGQQCKDYRPGKNNKAPYHFCYVATKSQ